MKDKEYLEENDRIVQTKGFLSATPFAYVGTARFGDKPFCDGYEASADERLFTLRIYPYANEDKRYRIELEQKKPVPGEYELHKGPLTAAEIEKLVESYVRERLAS